MYRNTVERYTQISFYNNVYKPVYDRFFHSNSVGQGIKILGGYTRELSIWRQLSTITSQ